MTSSENKFLNAHCNLLSWKPIVAGALVAIGLSFLLNLFTVAISLTAFSTDSQGVEILTLGGFIGTCIGIVASMFAAGWIAGYLGRGYCTGRHLGAIYGFLTWCLALLITIILASYFQQYLTYYGHFISGTQATFQVSAGNAAAATATLSASKLVLSAYIVFSLFFLSAFACSLGGHCGMRHNIKMDNVA